MAEREPPGCHNNDAPSSIVTVPSSAADPHARVDRDQPPSPNTSYHHIDPQIEGPILRDSDGDGGIEGGTGSGLLFLGEAILESRGQDPFPGRAVELQLRRFQSRSNLSPLI